MKKFAEIIIDFIESKGNDKIFGIQGVPNLPLYVSAYEKGINTLNNSSENFSVYSAIGSYSNEKKPQFVFLTIGPGLLGGLKAITNAYINNIPLFIITPYNRTSFDNLGEHHSVGSGIDEVNTSKIIDEVTCFNIEIKSLDNVYGLLEKAYDYCKEFSKPVNISIPYDFLELNLSEPIFKDIEIKKTKKNILILGSGLSREEIDYYLSLKIPYFFSGNELKGENISDYFLGSLSYNNNVFFDLLVKNKLVDEINILGVKGSNYNLGFLFYLSEKIKINHYGKSELEKSYFMFGKKNYYDFIKIKDFTKIDFENINLKNNLLIQKYIKTKKKEEKNDINHLVINQLNNISNSNIFYPVGGFEWWGRQYSGNETNNYFFPSQFLDMGQVMRVIGKSTLSDNMKNICVTGDGNFYMNLGELNTINNLGLNISIIVINNGGYNSLYNNYIIFNEGKNYNSKAPFGEYKVTPKLDKIAEAFGFNYYSFSLNQKEKFFDNINFDNKSIIEIIN